MILNSLPRNASLASFLHARAVAAPTRRLVLDIALGALVSIGAFVARPLGYRMMAAAGVCFVAYGIWALAERQLEDELVEMGRGPEVALTVVRGAAALAGLGSALVLLLMIVSGTLGTWIS